MALRGNVDEVMLLGFLVRGKSWGTKELSSCECEEKGVLEGELWDLRVWS